MEWNSVEIEPESGSNLLFSSIEMVNLSSNSFDKRFIKFKKPKYSIEEIEKISKDLKKKLKKKEEYYVID